MNCASCKGVMNKGKYLFHANYKIWRFSVLFLAISLYLPDPHFIVYVYLRVWNKPMY